MRRLTAAGWGALALLVLPVGARAHGIGGRQDLPVPLEYFVVGAGLVLALSFAALIVLWPRPRWQSPPPGRRLAGRGWKPAGRVTGTVGVAALALVVVAGLAGPDDPSRNPASVIVFVVFWLVVPFVSGLVGDLYPLFDPWRRLVRLMPRRPHPGAGRVAGRGYLPAVAVFVAFTWLELVAPASGPRSLALAALIYTAYLLAGAWWAGPAGSGLDGFAAYNRLLGAMGPLDFHGETPRWRGWLRGLTAVEERPGLVTMLVVMIGTVTFDGLSATSWWDAVGAPSITSPLGGLPVGAAGIVSGTVGLVGIPALVGTAYLAASAVAARMAGPGFRAGVVARRFAHSLVPIAYAYAFAHYFTLVIYEGQYLLASMSDPLGRGWDLFGTADRAVDFTLLSPVAVWWIQVTAIVLGHVAGVVLAHDRALADFPPATAVRSQYAMLALMVVLTGVGLAVLSAG
ncbi:MAG: fenitrothion hydrolase [Actinomycetota bacterium]